MLLSCFFELYLFFEIMKKRPTRIRRKAPPKSVKYFSRFRHLQDYRLRVIHEANERFKAEVEKHKK